MTHTATLLVVGALGILLGAFLVLLDAGRFPVPLLALAVTSSAVFAGIIALAAHFPS